jgi:amino acid transporter
MAAILFSAAVTVAGALLGRQAVLIFVNVGSFCIAVACLGVALSLIKIRRTTNETLSLPSRLVPYVAGLGSLFILGAMIVPGSPAMLPWPMEWIVLGAVSLTGTVFWFGATRTRKQLSETTRRQLILDGGGASSTDP